MIAMIEQGLRITKTEWRRKVVLEICKDEYYRWKAVCLMYKKLSIYRLVVMDLKESIWWKVAKEAPETLRACKFMIKLITGENGLEVNTGRFSNEQREERLCKLCKTDVETEAHFLLSCTELNLARVSQLY
jgi:hypothetical protein